MVRITRKNLEDLGHFEVKVGSDTLYSDVTLDDAVWFAATLGRNLYVTRTVSELDGPRKFLNGATVTFTLPPDFTGHTSEVFFPHSVYVSFQQGDTFDFSLTGKDPHFTDGELTLWASHFVQLLSAQEPAPDTHWTVDFEHAWNTSRVNIENDPLMWEAVGFTGVWGGTDWTWRTPLFRHREHPGWLRVAHMGAQLDVVEGEELNQRLARKVGEHMLQDTPRWLFALELDGTRHEDRGCDHHLRQAFPEFEDWLFERDEVVEREIIEIIQEHGHEWPVYLQDHEIHHQRACAYLFLRGQHPRNPFAPDEE